MVEVVTRERGAFDSNLDWGCVLAGAFVAVAVSSVMLLFGSGIGLSLVSPWTGTNGTVFALVTALWTVLSQLAAFGAGAYLAARMRKPAADGTSTEREFRDGVHGALVWAVGIVLAAVMAASAVSITARAGASAASSAASTAASNTSASDVTGYAIDTMFRSDKPSNGTPPTDPNAQRAEVGRIMAASVARGQVTQPDRTYLAQMIAQRTGLPQAEAEKRVDEAIVNAKSAADKARKVGIVAAFLTAAAALAAAAVAWSAGHMGGRHRDQGMIWRGFARRHELRRA